MGQIYLDHNSTTPVLPEVFDAMRPYWCETYGNPASPHQTGAKARRALEAAREQVADLLHAQPNEVYFTSGATEANNLAIFGLASGTILTSPVEHPSAHEPIQILKKRGHEVVELPVDLEGRVDAKWNSDGQEFGLINCMLANNETGTMQPVRALVESFNVQPGRRPFFHCDAVQAVGKVPVHFHELGVSTLSFSAHKFNGPKGIGGLLIRSGTPLSPMIYGGHQQQSRRPGTEPTALVVGLAKALQIAHEEMEERTQKLIRLRNIFLNGLRAAGVHYVLNGPEQGGLPNTINISFPGSQAEVLLIKLDLAGVACSTGSACSSGSMLPSPVLKAMGCPPEALTSALRFSLSHLNTEEETEKAVGCVMKST